MRQTILTSLSLAAAVALSGCGGGSNSMSNTGTSPPPPQSTPDSGCSGFCATADSFLTVRNLYLESRKTFQVQVFIAGPTEITDAQRQQAAQLLIAVRQRFHDLILNTESASPAHK